MEGILPFAKPIGKVLVSHFHPREDSSVTLDVTTLDSVSGYLLVAHYIVRTYPGKAKRKPSTAGDLNLRSSPDDMEGWSVDYEGLADARAFAITHWAADITGCGVRSRDLR